MYFPIKRFSSFLDPITPEACERGVGDRHILTRCLFHHRNAPKPIALLGVLTPLDRFPNLITAGQADRYAPVAKC